MHDGQLRPNVHQRYLDDLENLTVHRDLAVAAALDYCARERLSPPQWVIERAAVLLGELLMNEKATGPGRAGNRVSRYRHDQRDVERWNAVEEVRRIRAKSKYDAKLRREYGETPKSSKPLLHWLRMLEFIRRHGTFECASRYLDGRDARAGADAIKASYRRCIRRAGKKSYPDRFYRFDERFLATLGFPHIQDLKPGTKCVSLYDLT
jgi:hypothetical protein